MDKEDKQFDRFRVKMSPLSERENRTFIEKDSVLLDADIKQQNESNARILQDLVQRIKMARSKQRPVIMAFGAHTIKNGLAKILIYLMEQGWLTHLATNGAGVIHDWEFAYQGKSSEHVGTNVKNGVFGNWEETGYYINLAINIGAWEGKGYGKSVGAMIESENLVIPSIEELSDFIKNNYLIIPDRCAAAADLISIINRFNLKVGEHKIAHLWKSFSVQAAAYRLDIPFTSHPMIGHDIIYNHPMNHGASIGRTAEIDWLSFANSIEQLSGGVYMSIGSAVMSPMIFEKSFSMAQNVAIQNGNVIDDHFILVSDLAESKWDWSKGEPPENDPAYYLRFNKSFSRMGGTMRYLQIDNRDLLLSLAQMLED